jgi:hypothetical protein
MVYSGSSKIEFCNRLGNDWKTLADYLEIPPADQDRFERGDQGRGIWTWLENRGRLQELPTALQHIQRADLARVLIERPAWKIKGWLIAAVIACVVAAAIGVRVALIGPNSPHIQVSYYYRPAGQGELRTLTPGSKLRSGDHYKIWLTAEQDSYVYVFQIDSHQDIYRLFPRESLQGVAIHQTNPMRAGRQYQLPADDKAFILPDDRMGQEKIYVLAFQEPNTALEQLYDALEQARQQQNASRTADLQNLLLAKLQKGTLTAVPAFTFVHLEKK